MKVVDYFHPWMEVVDLLSSVDESMDESRLLPSVDESMFLTFIHPGMKVTLILALPIKPENKIQHHAWPLLQKYVLNHRSSLLVISMVTFIIHG